MASFLQSNPYLQASGPRLSLHAWVGFQQEKDLQVSGFQIPPALPVSALLDTGASNTFIDSSIASRLGLPLLSPVTIVTIGNQQLNCPRYFVRLYFSNQFGLEHLVLGAPLQGLNVQCLIGRDLLAQGVFVYLGCGGCFSLSV